MFDPLDLSIDVTPEAVIDAIKSHDLLTAIVLSFRLSDQTLLQKSVEAVAPNDGVCVCVYCKTQCRSTACIHLSHVHCLFPLHPLIANQLPLSVCVINIIAM